MLADERATAFVENFAGQWLFLRNLDAVVPVQSVFPDFDDTLRQGFRRETELFFDSIVREDRSALDLLRADYTFVNERLARHYGMPNVKGNHFRRVTLPADSPRRGLLGQGSILTVTSYPDRTSPVVRGKWILENLLGTPPPPPPADVPELEETSDGGGTLSMRERIAQHRANPSCASCHAMMDPLGFALENFDAVGGWRTLDESGGADRRVGRAARRHAVRGRRRVPRARSSIGPVRDDADREAADLRPRPRPRALRPAGRARDRARRGGERLSLLGVDRAASCRARRSR